MKTTTAFVLILGLIVFSGCAPKEALSESGADNFVNVQSKDAESQEQSRENAAEMDGYSVMRTAYEQALEEDWLALLSEHFEEEGRSPENIDYLMQHAVIERWMVSVEQQFEHETGNIPFSVKFDIVVWISEGDYAIYGAENIRMECKDENVKVVNEPKVRFAYLNTADMQAEAVPQYTSTATFVGVSAHLYYGEEATGVTVATHRYDFTIAPFSAV